MVLGVVNDGVTVAEENFDNSSGQIWEIGKSDHTSGYFTISNPTSKKLLTALAAFDLRIYDGMLDVFVNCLMNVLHQHYILQILHFILMNLVKMCQL